MRLDLHRPAGAPRRLPVIVWIPVGGWRGSAKENAPIWLTEHGFAVASPDCRVSGEAIAPAAIHDCKAAVRWLRANSGQYGLDPERVGSAGSSAGGHLSALLAVSHGVEALEGDGGNPDQSSAVRAALAVCGPTDLSRIAIPEIRQQFPVLYEVTENFLGGPVAERAELARLMSPLTYASGECPPLLVVHGEEDPTVPVEESHIFYKALQEAGADVCLEILEGVGHGCPWDRIGKSVVSFFQRRL
jgi:acetyl esterase/lipase